VSNALIAIAKAASPIWAQMKKDKIHSNNTHFYNMGSFLESLVQLPLVEFVATDR
jgi:hypothetical protein